MEKTVAIEWANAVRSKDAVDISHVFTSTADPPDCFALCKGRRISIELTELVNSKILRQISVARRQGKVISASDDLFNEAQWTPQLLKSEIDKRLDYKHRNYLQRGVLQIDVLVIHTAEPWLSPNQIAEWLSAMEFAPRSSFKTAYLLMSYFPGYADHWPVFTIYGAL